MHAERFAGESQMLDAEISGALNHDAKQRRMRMQMMVAVHVIERQSGRAEFFKLRQHFSAELFAQFSFEEILEADAHRTVVEFPVFIHQPRNFLARQSGVALQEGEMQSNT